ncbi:MAG: hypothetical protein O2931_04860 [Planctomycetota bacterium]|nr:hypothetical protein [Planctomycetota bacterium]MDA1178112.1 hypothetical protein [Planctomycetota bacterium]
MYGRPSIASCIPIAGVSPTLRAAICVAFISGLISLDAGHLSAAVPETEPSFESDVAPLFNRYCAGCHNPDEKNGKLDLTSYSALMEGSEHGTTITPGSVASSRLMGVLTGKIEPEMPPPDEPRPTAEELDVLARWIESGAAGPSGEASRPILRVPDLPSSRRALPITALDISPDGEWLAIGRFQSLELRQVGAQDAASRLDEHVGKVNDVRFSLDGEQVLTATGVEGLQGEACLWDLTTKHKLASFGGHRDVLYAADLSSDGRWVATGGYDKVVLIHDRATGQIMHRLAEHNGAVFDLCFSPDAKLLATCSADATVKIWNVASGLRLDTRSEPLKEQITTAFHPSGTSFVGAGADNRIRQWQLVVHDEPQICPLLQSRFAHDGAVEKLRFSRNGRYLASVGRDRSLKVWDAEQLKEIALFPLQPAAVQALAVDPNGTHVTVGRMDGSLETYPIVVTPSPIASHAPTQKLALSSVPSNAQTMSVTELEPNGWAGQPQTIELPAMVTGVIDREADASDAVDVFAMHCRAGERWILEVNAARSKSPLDSHIEVLDAQSNPVPRVVLQAVRDSYFSFRGASATTVNAIRLQNWEEMRMHQFLYCNGEVMRLWHYPRGPDSGFSVFPNEGARHTMFDTTAIVHPLGETCYIVEPYAPADTIVPNGLPAFTIYYENDDDSERKAGTDSRLTFDVPHDGRYLVRLRDTRHFSGAEYTYQLSIRPPAPKVSIKSVSGINPVIPRGTGVKLGVVIDRTDGFDGPVRVDVVGVPPGFHITTPIIIERGQLQAFGRLWADEQATDPSDATPPITLVASTEVAEQQVTLPPYELGRPKLKEPSTLLVRAESNVDNETDAETGWPVMKVKRGSSTSIRLSVERLGHEARVNFGGHDCVSNAPYGVYVGNSGLNGVLIPENETERSVVVIADAITEPGDRCVFFTTADGGGATTNPVLLRVLE